MRTGRWSTLRLEGQKPNVVARKTLETPAEYTGGKEKLDSKSP
jgi:uncharacterized membrane-anchored protein